MIEILFFVMLLYTTHINTCYVFLLVLIGECGKNCQPNKHTSLNMLGLDGTSHSLSGFLFVVSLDQETMCIGIFKVFWF